MACADRKMPILQFWQYWMFWSTCTHAANQKTIHLPDRRGRDQSFTMHWITVHGVTVMCKSRSNPKGKHNLEWEMRVLHLHPICNQIQSWKRKGLVQGLPAACTFSIYREEVPSPHSPRLRKGKQKGWQFWFSLAVPSQRWFILLQEKKEWDCRFLLRIFCGFFFLPFHNNPPIEHFCKPSLLYPVRLNSQASPCRFGDVH